MFSLYTERKQGGVKLTVGLKVNQKVKTLLLGAGLAFVTVVILQLFSPVQVIDLLAVLLAVIGAIYIGFVLSDEQSQETSIQIGAAVFTILLAIGGLWISPYLLVLGYFFHGAWDIVHHYDLLKTRVVNWYPPLCAIYDWLMAGYILLWWMNI